jgi:hypothetical protein
MQHRRLDTLNFRKPILSAELPSWRKKKGRRGVPPPAAKVIMPTSTPMELADNRAVTPLHEASVSRCLHWDQTFNFYKCSKNS